jgi:hypothetical protein
MAMSNAHKLEAIFMEFFGGSGLPRALELADDLFASGECVSIQGDALTNEDLAIRDAESIVKLALLTVRRHVLEFGPHAKLVAYLVRRGQLTLDEACDLLAARGVQQSLDANMRRLIDVVWHVAEDKKDGFIAVDNDNLLRDALFAVAPEKRSGLS